MSSIRFICHGCRRPLKLVRTAEAPGLDLGQDPGASYFPSAQGDLGGDTPEEGSASSPEADLEEQLQASAWHILGDDGELSEDPPPNFTLLGELAAAGGTLSSIQRTATGLWDILSGEELGHPLCEDCTDSLLEQVDRQLSISESDIQTYRRCLEARRGGCGEDASLRQELEVLELEEARLVQELEEVERHRDGAAVALQEARAETERLEQQQRRYPRDLGELQWQGLGLQDELRSLEDRLRHARAQLARLSRTNAFKATFDIGCEGPIAVINGRRLGCAPRVPVSWGEINEAWGHTALLLASLARTVDLRFQRYQLVPRGDRSYLWSLAAEDPGVQLPLFCTGGKSSLWDSRFDRAMVAFLDCMQQFHQEAQKAEPALCMPYRIHAERGQLEDPGSGRSYSVRTRLHTEEQWTTALKFMLTNFKWSLDWVSLRYRPREPHPDTRRRERTDRRSRPREDGQAALVGSGGRD